MSFSEQELADFFESMGSDLDVAVDFMAELAPTDEGKDFLGRTATILAKRDGVSGNTVKTFRSTLRAACKKAGIADILTPRKVKGTGTKSNPDPEMYIGVSKSHSDDAKKSGEQMAYDRMSNWLKKGDITLGDIMSAAERLEADHLTVSL